MSSFSFLMLHKLTFDGECCTNMQLCPVVSKPHFIEVIKTFFFKVHKHVLQQTHSTKQSGLCALTVDPFLLVQEYSQHR